MSPWLPGLLKILISVTTMSESEEESTNNQIKITLLGDSSVGKVCSIDILIFGA